MVIVTYQSPDVLTALESKGYVCCKSPQFALDCSSMMYAYRWMAEKMRERIGPPCYDGVEFPLWGWAQQVCSRKEIRPHGRDFDPEAGEVAMLTLDIPESRLLLSDFDDWHAPLNQIPVYTIGRERRKLQKCIDSFNSERGVHFEDYPEELRRRIEYSWNLIFDLNQFGHGFRMRRNRTIQATFWEIRKEWVRDVRVLDTKAF